MSKLRIIFTGLPAIGSKHQGLGRWYQAQQAITRILDDPSPDGLNAQNYAVYNKSEKNAKPGIMVALFDADPDVVTSFLREHFRQAKDLGMVLDELDIPSGELQTYEVNLQELINPTVN